MQKPRQHHCRAYLNSVSSVWTGSRSPTLRCNNFYAIYLTHNSAFHARTKTNWDLFSLHPWTSRSWSSHSSIHWLCRSIGRPLYLLRDSALPVFLPCGPSSMSVTYPWACGARRRRGGVGGVVITYHHFLGKNNLSSTDYTVITPWLYVSLTVLLS